MIRSIRAGVILFLVVTGSWLSAASSGDPLVVGPMDGCNNNNLCCKVCDPDTGKCVITKCERSGPATEVTEDCPHTGSVTAFNLRYRHSSWDYLVQAPGSGGCTPCGQQGPTDDTNGPATVNLLRSHFPDTDLIGSFGPNWGCNWDIWLRCFQPGTIASGRPTGVSGWQILIQQPTKQPIDFLVGVDGDGDGIYADPKASWFKSLCFYDAMGALVLTPDLASSAVLTTHEGEIFRFEIFFENPGNLSSILGRFTRFEDRNQRAVVSTYKYAVTDPLLTGTLRTKLRIRDAVTDSTGRSLRFTYNETTQVQGQWVVSRIDLPTAGVLEYRYGTVASAWWGTRQTLTGVIHPDGTQSSFSAVIDPALSCVRWTCEEPHDQPTSRRKTVWLTTAPWKNPANPANQVNQIFNRVRQIANGAGEITFQATIKHVTTPAGLENRTYLFDQGRLSAVVHDHGDALTAVYERTVGDGNPFVFLSTDWTGWVRSKSWTPGPNRNEPAVAADGVGNVTSYVRTVTDQATSVVHPDGSTESWTYNAFTQPLVIVDRLGRRTEHVYDGAGNRLATIRGAGSAEASTWTWTYWGVGDVEPGHGLPGQVRSVIDANGNATDYFYAANGDLIQVVEPADEIGGPRATWQFAYDDARRLVSKTDPQGRVTGYAWDACSRLVETTYADGSRETQTYAVAGADAGLLLAKSDRNGNRTAYRYDLAGRTIAVVEAEGTAEAVESHTIYVPGTKHIPVSETRAGDTTTYTYDSRMRRVSVTRQPRLGTLLVSQTAYDNSDRVIAETDAYGRRTLLVYDQNARVVRVVRECVPGGVPVGADPATLPRILGLNPPYHIEDSVLDAEGQLVARIDGRGIQSRMIYDAQGRLVEQVEAHLDCSGPSPAIVPSPVAARMLFAYDLQGNRIAVTLPRSFLRQGDGSWIAGPDGAFITTTTYTGRNLPRLVTEAAGLDALGAVRPERRDTLTTYTLTRKVASVRNARGFTTTYGYGACCDRLEQISDPAGALTSIGYDAVGNRILVTDANALPTSTAYDGRHRVIQSVNGAGEITRMVYDDSLIDGIGLDADPVVAAQLADLGLAAGSDGSAMRVINPRGEATTTLSDGLGRTVCQIDALGHATVMVYDALVTGADGAILVETTQRNPLGHVVRSRTDGCGLVRETVDALGFVATQAYDAAGAVRRTRDANGIGKDCQLDARGRDIACTDTAGALTSRTFDSHGNVVRSVDAMGQATTTVFDALDRSVLTTDRIGAVTRFVYDAGSNLISITDAEGGITDYLYDNRDLLVQETFPTGQRGRTRRSYAYDLGRRLTARQVTTVPVTSFSQVTGYVYDGANRLVARTAADGKHDTFAYDAASRLIQASSARYQNRVERQYDADGRLTHERLAGAGSAALPGVWDVWYGYDAADRVVAVTYPDGSDVRRTFTPRHQLETLSFDGSAVLARAYDAGGRLTTSTLGNGLSETRTYTPGDHLVATLGVPGVTAFSYSYDANKRKRTESDGAVAAGTQTFGYDDADRLTTWSRSAGVVPTQTQTWNLSPVGDWKTTTRDGITETRTHTKVHELTKLQVGSAAAVSLTYDQKGNLTRDEEGRSYSWDIENRLSKATIPAAVSPTGLQQTATYVYDALGRRVAKTVNGVVTRFLHAGAQVVQEEDGIRVASAAEAASDGSVENAALEPVDGGLLTGSDVIRIDFQPVSAPIPPGFFADKGRAYGLRSNGQIYGWSPETTSSDRVKRFAAPTEEADTFIRAHRPGQSVKTWQIALPNGVYPVLLVCGDATSRNHTNNLVIEGIAVTDSDPATGVGYERGDFDGYAVLATVTDGTLTIAPGAGHYDPTVCYLEIGAAGSALDAAAVARLETVVERLTTATFAPQAPVVGKRRYGYGSYVDDCVLFINGTTKFYPHANHLYSVAAVTDSVGEIVERYRYDAYGKRTVMNASGTVILKSGIGMQRGFTGYVCDNETGLMYARARMYSTTMGRFVARDSCPAQTRWRNGILFIGLPRPAAGYQDGMGLYSAYMVPNTLDPSGWRIDVPAEQLATVKPILEQIAAMACMKVRVQKIKGDDTQVAVSFVDDPAKSGPAKEKRDKGEKCCECSPTLRRILERINGLELTGNPTNTGAPSSNLGMPSLGISTSRPGAAGGFGPASAAFQSAHEMAHYLPGEKGGALTDEAVNAAINDVYKELCLDWRRTLNHDEEVFINIVTKQKKTIDGEGGITDGTASDAEIGGLSPSTTPGAGSPAAPAPSTGATTPATGK